MPFLITKANKYKEFTYVLLYLTDVLHFYSIYYKCIKTISCTRPPTRKNDQMVPFFKKKNVKLFNDVLCFSLGDWCILK